MVLQQAGLMQSARCQVVCPELLHWQLLDPLSFGAAAASAPVAVAAALEDAIAALHC
jgi:hypothetical protein